MIKPIIIRPSEPWWKIDFAEIWQYKNLLYVLAWRDVTVRYKQTVLGILWAVFQPLVTTGIFSIFFGTIAKIPSDGLPYPLFTFIGLALWNFFSSGIANASNSLITNASIITKVYFPRFLVPFASIATSGVDFAITLLLVLVAILLYGYIPSIQTLYVFPMLLVILVLAMGGLGLMTAAINIKFRDVRYILPFFIQIGLYITPIIYPLSVIHDYRRWILMLNPMTAVIESSRALVNSASLDWLMISIGFLVALGLFILGLYLFRKTEYLFVDIS